LNIGDKYYIDGENKIKTIDTPKDLRTLYDDVNKSKRQIVKKYTQQRDLAVTKITWDEDIVVNGINKTVGNNLFCIDSTKALI